MWEMNEDALKRLLEEIQRMDNPEVAPMRSASFVLNAGSAAFRPAIKSNDIATLDSLIDIVLDMERPDFFAQLTDLRKRLGYYLSESMEGKASDTDQNIRGQRQ